MVQRIMCWCICIRVLYFYTLTVMSGSISSFFFAAIAICYSLTHTLISLLIFFFFFWKFLRTVHPGCTFFCRYAFSVKQTAIEHMLRNTLITLGISSLNFSNERSLNHQIEQKKKENRTMFPSFCAKLPVVVGLSVTKIFLSDFRRVQGEISTDVSRR